MKRGRWLLAVLICALIGGATSAPAVLGGEPTVDADGDAMAVRAAFGLDASAARVAELQGSSEDVGTPLWGIPLTRDEMDQIDLPGRMAFADAVDTRLLTHLRNLPTYGGAHFDQAAGGLLTIGLTELDATVVGDINQRLAGQAGPWRIVEVKRTEHELDQLARDALKLWQDALPGGSVLGVGTEVEINGLFVEVADDGNARAAEEIDIGLDVPIVVRVADPGRDTDCTSRKHCHDPTRAGINIYGKADFDPNSRCTMGFHVRRTYNGDEQFLSAGHCGYLWSRWYHQAIGLLGSVQQNIYANGYDVMRVQLPNDQVSRKIYGEDSLNITGSGTPIDGETLCASLGAGSSTIKCGVVQNPWRSWVSETAGYTVWGGNMSYTTIDGDSGSPVYRVVTGQPDTFRAIGINTHENGYFARVDLALTSLAVTIVN